ncbi:MAG TPA: hypothetical protein ENH82_07975 [bacterium]|nr:hypothetical protein [bacterium]
MNKEVISLNMDEAPPFMEKLLAIYYFIGNDTTIKKVLNTHDGHKAVVVTYSIIDVKLECDDCNEVLASF